jgi:hypothetical protein
MRGYKGNALRKHETCVYEYVTVIDTDEHAVHPDLAKTTNGEHAQWGAFTWRWTWEASLVICVER